MNAYFPAVSGEAHVLDQERAQFSARRARQLAEERGLLDRFLRVEQKIAAGEPADDKEIALIWVEASRPPPADDPQRADYDRAVAAERREKAAMWRSLEPEMLEKNPWGLAYLALAYPSPADLGAKHTHDAIRAALARRLGAEVERVGAIIEADADPDAANAQAFDLLRQRPEWKSWEEAYREYDRTSKTRSADDDKTLRLAVLVPAFNELDLGVKLCEACGRPFAAADGRGARGRFCGDSCARSTYERERRRQNSQRSLAEKLAAAKRTLELHRDRGCCTAGDLCDPGKAIWERAVRLQDEVGAATGGDAMSRVSQQASYDGSGAPARSAWDATVESQTEPNEPADDTGVPPSDRKPK
jgi:hypothetical protein